ncbi:MAG: YdcF family protein [Leptolyngbyaceae cyanobacterium CSU_1_4]|nr:YdcF family protein [Leptolyngbyaceae cyanobacterium CSU_1_4]
MAALLILLVSSLPVTAYLLTAQSEQRPLLETRGQQEVTAARGVEAIVVLGDGGSPTDPTYRIRSQLSSGEDGISVGQRSRLFYAAQLYSSQQARGNDPLVIVSVGPRPVEQEGISETSSVTNLLTANGVPEDRIRIDLEGVDPRTSAVVSQRLLASNDSPTRVPIMIVAPVINIRRVSSSFAKLNFDVIPRPTDFYVFQLQGGLRLAAASDLIPNVEALVITTRVVDEYLATVYYFLRGWLVDPLTV